MVQTVESSTIETPKGKEILKEPVVAFAIVGAEHDEGTFSMYPQPISVQHPMEDAVTEDVFVGEGEVLEVVPAPDNCYRIWAEGPEKEGKFEIVGYEYPGASNPDWDRAAEEHHS